MKIPKRFTLFAEVITVKIEDDYFRTNEREGYDGFACYRTNTIYLRPCDNQQKLESTFLHEMTHFIFHRTNVRLDKDITWIHQDEYFVEATAKLFHQALTTFEYGKKEIETHDTPKNLHDENKLGNMDA